MAKANRDSVSDRYAEEGATVTRAVGDVKEVITADTSNEILDLNVPGQTPAELKKSGNVEPPSEPVYLNRGSDASDEQTGETVETAPGGGVTEARAREVANEEKGAPSSRGSSSARSTQSNAGTSEKNKNNAR